MGEEDGIKPGSGDGMEMHQSHDERLGLGDVRLGEITHADAGTGDSQDEPQREVILEERDVADTGIAHAAEQEEADGEEEKSAGPEEPRGANLHDAVDGFDKAHTAGNRIHEEAEVAEEDDEEAVMEKETENPEPLGGIVNQAGALVDGIIGFDFRVDVAEKRTEQEQNYINNAKWLLMERNHMTEQEAFRYIQKSSMDSGTNMVETAQMILLLIYDG